MREFVTGAEIIARAAIDAGCDFFAGYPITPATPILQYMLRDLPPKGGVAIQAEDEIASMGLCIGAALSGSRAMTATSGPGISLYSENIGMAIMGEVPIVIVDCQRMGPSTGGATTTSQGDTQFLRWGTSGGYPLIVLAPTWVRNCYHLTMQAFDLAERFRIPVILATDKETVLASETLETDALVQPSVRERPLAPEGRPFVPYRAEGPSAVPPMSHFGGPHIVRFTSSSHDEHGYMTKDPGAVERLNRRLAAKVEDHLDEISLVESDIDPNADTLILSYGITARSAAEAVRLARQEGASASAITVLSLWPVPEQELRAAMESAKRIVVPELNLGLYRREIERLASDGQQVIGVHRVDGELISPGDILEQGGLR